MGRPDLGLRRARARRGLHPHVVHLEAPPAAELEGEAPVGQVGRRQGQRLAVGQPVHLVLEGQTVLLEAGDAHAIPVTGPVTLPTDGSEGLRIRAGVVEMHRAGAARVAVDEQVAPGDRAGVGEVAGRQHIADPRSVRTGGPCGGIGHVHRHKVEADLDPTPDLGWPPRERLPRAEPPVAASAALEELQHAVTHPGRRTG